MKKLILLAIAWLLPLAASGNEYLFVNHNSYSFGMFSVFNYVLGVLAHYDKGNFAGIEVDFETWGLYYDQAKGANWWTYYCDPIRFGSSQNAVVKRFNPDEYVYYAYFIKRNFSRKDAHRLIAKYVKIKPHIKEKIARFATDEFSIRPIISVHYRGTDKTIETPRVPYEQVEQAVSEYIASNRLKDYRIFIATDEKPFLDFMLDHFPNRVIYQDAARSREGLALHLYACDPYKQGEEALIDSVLLSKGDILIRTCSNLSLWSAYFNPEIPVILLEAK